MNTLEYFDDFRISGTIRKTLGYVGSRRKALKDFGRFERLWLCYRTHDLRARSADNQNRNRTHGDDNNRHDNVFFS